jgi:hypothetical protein
VNLPWQEPGASFFRMARAVALYPPSPDALHMKKFPSHPSLSPIHSNHVTISPLLKNIPSQEKVISL